MTDIRWERYPFVAQNENARRWLTIEANSQLAPNTVDAYGRGVQDYLSFFSQISVSPESATKEHVLLWIKELAARPNLRSPGALGPGPAAGLSNATMQQKLTAVRLFNDYLMEEGVLKKNPAGRGRYTPGLKPYSQIERGILRRPEKLPWIPTEEQWQALLEAAKSESLRNRFMFALQYDCALRREELCSLEDDDFNPTHRVLTIRAEITKSMRARVLVYSVETAALRQAYLKSRPVASASQVKLFLSESRRNYGQPISIWTWSKVIKAIATRAKVPQFSTHTHRHLRLTDLARSGWDTDEIAAFAGHRNTSTTIRYIHLSGGDLKKKLERGMASIHAWREAKIKELMK